MIETLSQLLVYVPGIALFPIPIILAIIILRTSRAAVRLAAYLSGWMLGIGVVGGVAIALINPYYDSILEQFDAWVGWLRLGFGVILIGLAGYQLRNLILTKRNETSKLMGQAGQFSVWQWLGTGLFLSSVSLKNILLIIGAATIVVESGANLSQQIKIWTIFTMLTSLGIASPVLIWILWRHRATAILDRLYMWMEQYSGGLIAVLTLVMGLLLIGEALEVLVVV